MDGFAVCGDFLRELQCNSPAKEIAMAANALVQARIDWAVKDEAAIVCHNGPYRVHCRAVVAHHGGLETVTLDQLQSVRDADD